MEYLKIDNDSVPHNIIYVKPDGACLFRTLSVLMYGTSLYHPKIRLYIASYVYQQWEEFKFYTSDEEGNNYASKKDYISEMLKKTTFGTYSEIMAAGRLYNYKFEVFRNGQLFTSSGLETDPVRRLRFTGKLSGGHFDAYKVCGVVNNKKKKTRYQIIQTYSELFFFIWYFIYLHLVNMILCLSKNLE